MTDSNENGAWTPPMRFLLRKNLIRTLLKQENLDNKSCLEIGYGAGELLFLYKSMGLDVFGFDFSDDAVAYTSQRVENDKTPRPIHLHESDEESKSRKYDYLMAFEVLEHIEDDVAALKDWRDRLNDSGKIIISVPAHESKRGALDTLAGHFRRYERAGLRDVFEAADMRVDHIWCYGYPLTIALDPMLHGWAEKQLEARNVEGRSMEDLTKSSGLFTKSSLAMRVLSNDIALFPFYLMQRPLRNTDIGSGYVVMASK